MSKNLEPQAVFRVSTKEQQKAYLHPLRMKILGFLASDAKTVSQVAGLLQVHPANITHHFRALEKAKLIRLVEERDIGRVVERYYRAVAKIFDILPPEGSVENANGKVLTFLRNDLTSAIGGLKGDDSENVIGLIRKARIGPARFMEFAKRLEGLTEEFAQVSEREDLSSLTYAMNVSLYPHKADYGPMRRIEYRKKKVPGG